MRIALDVAAILSIFTVCRLLGDMGRLRLPSLTRFAIGFFMLLLSFYVGNPEHYRNWHEIAQSDVSFILLALGAVLVYSGVAQGAIEVWNWACLKWEKEPSKGPLALFAGVGAALRKMDRGDLTSLLLFGIPFSLCLALEALSPHFLRGAVPSLGWLSTALLWAWIVTDRVRAFIRKREHAGSKPVPSKVNENS